jgi:hypothetical protein
MQPSGAQQAKGDARNSRQDNAGTSREYAVGGTLSALKSMPTRIV